MAKPSGHRDCRTREFLLALTTDDVRHALEEASGDELAPVLSALGVQAARSAGRKAPQLLRTRLRALGHDASHDVACFLTQPSTRALEELLPQEEGDLEAQLRAGPLDTLRRTWPRAMVRLTLEVMWHLGDLTTDQRDRLLAYEETTDPAEPHPSPEPVAEAAVGAPTAGAPVVASALDRLVADAVARARTQPAAEGLDGVRAALVELLAVDPARTDAWYQYGLVLGASAGPPVPGPARLAFFRGRARGLADAGDAPGLRDWTSTDRGSLDEVLARPEGAEIAGAVLSVVLDEPRLAARLLGLAPVPFEGWERLAREVRDHGDATEAELLLRAMEDALWRWGQGFEREATSLRLERVARRRRRGDFVGAARLLSTVDDECLEPGSRAVAAFEHAMSTAEIAGPEAVRFPSGEAEWARLVDRLRPIRRHLLDALDAGAGAGPAQVTANLLLGMLQYAEGDTSAAATLARACTDLAEHSDLDALHREVRFHAALSRLRQLEPGTDEAAYHEMAAAMADGYAPGPDDLAASVVALEAHGSPHAGPFLTRALAAAPMAPALVRLVAERARTGDLDSGRTAEEVAADSQLPLSVRFELLDGALEGAGVRHDVAAGERLVGTIDDVLVRAGDAALDERFADALARNEVLRFALDPANADALRLEVLRRIGRVEEARGIAAALFYRAAGGGLRNFDAVDLFTVLVELGLARAELDDLARLLPSPPDGEEPATVPDRRVHVLFVGGNETQDRYRPVVDAAIATRYGGKVSISWFLSGWRSNWQSDAARVEAAYPSADVVVLMSFVRTHLGQRIRRSAGEHGLPWVACTGHGREAIQRAVERAVAVVVPTAERTTDHGSSRSGLHEAARYEAGRVG